MEFRTIRYKRHEFHTEHQHGTLLTLVYDIPYFPPCGIFPPLHILNEKLKSGGNDGGMSPGATWEPFALEETEYAELIAAIKATPLSEIEAYARFAHLQHKFDSSFDGITNYTDWMFAICNKHRDSWHDDLRRAGKLA